MKINGNAVKPGNVIQHEDGLWVTVKAQAVKPGKGGAFNQVELKNLITGNKLNTRFRADEMVERVRLEQREHTFLFGSDDTLTFMDAESYEQIELQKDFVGERAAFLQDGMTVTVEFHEETPIGIALPEQATVTVVETEPSIKGQTATSSYKPAMCDNGVRVMVPPFVDIDTQIIVNTEDCTYVKRAE